MPDRLLGIHHVTAIAGDAQRNVDFYAGTLGLRLVKRTVNFDDQYTYHLYYGDGLGRPGTILTFFPWNAAKKGVSGYGQVNMVTLAIPVGSAEYWRDRLTTKEVKEIKVNERKPSLSCLDPDGLLLRLVEKEADTREGWTGSDVPGEYAIRGIDDVMIYVSDEYTSSTFLEEVMDFKTGYTYTDYSELYTSQEPGANIIVSGGLDPNGPQGQMGVGSVHHVAFRTPDETTLLEWRAKLIAHGLHVTPVMDRNYFRSIYFREPGGVLYEIATDTPGFTVDESEETLGTALRLPASLEANWERIERGLPKLVVP